MKTRSPKLPLASALALALAVSGTARAQEESEAEPPERTRVAVLIVTTGDLDPAMADGLTEVLIGAVAARGNMTIVGKEEFQAQLGQGDEGTLDCIGSMACMGRVGVQLDVAEVIAGSLARRDERWVFNLNRVDVRAGEIRGRVFREIEGDLGAVADALGAAIPELYVPPPEPEPPAAEPAGPPQGTLRLTTAVAGAEVFLDDELVGHTREEGLELLSDAGSVELRIEASGYHRWTRTARIRPDQTLRLVVDLEEAWNETLNPWAWIGGGLAVAALAVAIPIGVSSQERFEVTDEQRASGVVTMMDEWAYYQSRAEEALAANVLYGVAGVLALSAAATLFFPLRDRVEGVAVAPTPGGLVARGTFR